MEIIALAVYGIIIIQLTAVCWILSTRIRRSHSEFKQAYNSLASSLEGLAKRVEYKTENAERELWDIRQHFGLVYASPEPRKLMTFTVDKGDQAQGQAKQAGSPHVFPDSLG